MSAGQLPLALPHRPATGRADFLVGAANSEAVAWLDRWPDWPGGCLCLYGPAASGKSHLVAVWQAMSGGAVWDGARLAVGPAAEGTPAPPGTAPSVPAAVAVEDADRCPAREALLHWLNAVREAGGTMLLTARTPPATWAGEPPDLLSRLHGGSRVALASPGDDLLAAVLVKQFRDRQLRVPSRVVAYLLPRMPRSFAAAQAVVERLDRRSLAEKRRITVALAREILAELGEGKTAG